MLKPECEDIKELVTSKSNCQTNVKKMEILETDAALQPYGSGLCKVVCITEQQ